MPESKIKNVCPNSTTPSSFRRRRGQICGTHLSWLVRWQFPGKRSLPVRQAGFVPRDDDSFFSFAFLRFTLFIVAVLFSSCVKNAEREQQLKSLDSISGALNQKLAELKQVDTVILQKAISKYNNYKQFIQQNINDTINKNEADHVQQFLASGKILLNFSENRKSILARGSLINSQISKLMTDAKENSLDNEKFVQFSTEEKNNAEQLIKGSYGQQQLFQANLQEFKLSLSGIEQLIRDRNNGQMPTVIKDSIPL